MNKEKNETTLEELGNLLNNYFEKYDVLNTHEPIPTKRNLLKHINLTNDEFENMRKNDNFGYILDRALQLLECILESFLYATNDTNEKFENDVFKELTYSFGWVK